MGTPPHCQPVARMRNPLVENGGISDGLLLECDLFSLWLRSRPRGGYPSIRTRDICAVVWGGRARDWKPECCQALVTRWCDMVKASPGDSRGRQCVRRSWVWREQQQRVLGTGGIEQDCTQRSWPTTVFQGSKLQGSGMSRGQERRASQGWLHCVSPQRVARGQDRP